jgi:hypothetical protein
MIPYQMQSANNSSNNSTYFEKNFHSIKTNASDNEQNDFFMLVRLEGKNLDDIENKKNKMHKIVNESAKILDLGHSGNVTLTVLNPKYNKNNFLFTGKQKSIKINLFDNPVHDKNFEFKGVRKLSF